MDTSQYCCDRKSDGTFATAEKFNKLMHTITTYSIQRGLCSTISTGGEPLVEDDDDNGSFFFFLLLLVLFSTTCAAVGGVVVGTAAAAAATADDDDPDDDDNGWPISPIRMDFVFAVALIGLAVSINWLFFFPFLLDIGGVVVVVDDGGGDGVATATISVLLLRFITHVRSCMVATSMIQQSLSEGGFTSHRVF
jgi:hypothetical protein